MKQHKVVINRVDSAGQKQDTQDNDCSGHRSAASAASAAVVLECGSIGRLYILIAECIDAMLPPLTGESDVGGKLFLTVVAVLIPM